MLVLVLVLQMVSVAGASVLGPRAAASSACPAPIRAVLSSVPSPHPQAVALTFDDGPSPRWTPQVLDILHRLGVRATFFVTGTYVDAFPALARRIVDEGHTIGNHTYSHPNLDGLSAAAQATQVDRTTQAIVAATGVRPCFFRGPYGSHHGRSIKDIVWSRGMSIAGWSHDTRDYQTPLSYSPAFQQTIVGRATVPQLATPMVLMHDGAPGNYRQNSVDAVERIVAFYASRGYLFTDPAGRPAGTWSPGPPTGVLDAVQTAPGWLRATGWALQRNSTASVKVQVKVDGTAVRDAIADVPRPDVGLAHPGAGDRHGFDVALPVVAGPHEVCVDALGGTSTALGCVALDVSPPVVVPLPAACPPAGDARFDDVPVDAWYAAHVDCGVVHQLLLGVAPRSYQPAAMVTRGQVASFVFRLLQRTERLPGEVPNAFHDDDGSVHEAAIDALAAIGVAVGRSPGVFEPEAVVTRAQAASFLVRLQESFVGSLPAAATTFEDLDALHGPAVEKASAAGLTSGTTPWTFAPGSTVRRDQFGVFLVRSLGWFEREGLLAAR